MLSIVPGAPGAVIYDFHASPGERTRLARSAGKRGAKLVLSRRLRRQAARLAHEDVLVLDAETASGAGAPRSR